MNEVPFKAYLKKRGKKDHVIDGLIGHVKNFEEYLKKLHRQTLDNANSPQLKSYIDELKKSEPGIAGKRCRGIALYYKFFGNKTMASIASDFREKEIAKTRKRFLLKDFKGIDRKHALKLKEVGIADTSQMLKAGKTPQDRRSLSRKTGIPSETVLEFVKLSDLARITAVKGIRARLYYEAGIDTAHKLSQWRPEKLREYLLDYVKRSGFDGIAPLPKEIEYTINEAKNLPNLVKY